MITQELELIKQKYPEYTGVRGYGFKDLTGKIFGQLTVLYQSAESTPKGARWVCQCSCGNISVARSSTLCSGATKSCGCAQQSRLYKSYEPVEDFVELKKDYPEYSGLIGSDYRNLVGFSSENLKVCYRYFQNHNGAPQWVCTIDSKPIIKTSYQVLHYKMPKKPKAIIREKICWVQTPCEYEKEAKQIYPEYDGEHVKRICNLTGQVIGNYKVLYRGMDEPKSCAVRWVVRELDTQQVSLIPYRRLYYIINHPGAQSLKTYFQGGRPIDEECPVEYEGLVSPKCKDLRGQQYGNLIVLYRSGEPSTTKKNNVIWVCRCLLCGSLTSVSTWALTSGNTTSCGCLERRVLYTPTSINEYAELKIKWPEFEGSLGGSFDDKRGTKIGSLSPLYLTSVRQPGDSWVCRCDCGHYRVVNRLILRDDLRSVNCCRECLKRYSNGERFVERTLIKMGITYQSEYSFSDLKDKGKLRFDFAILNETRDVVACIEYDGLQHYGPIENSSFATEEYWEVLHRHDEQKNQYCSNHNIPLLRISYVTKTEQEIEQVIQDFLSKCLSQ